MLNFCMRTDEKTTGRNVSVYLNEIEQVDPNNADPSFNTQGTSHDSGRRFNQLWYWPQSWSDAGPDSENPDSQTIDSLH